MGYGGGMSGKGGPAMPQYQGGQRDYQGGVYRPTAGTPRPPLPGPQPNGMMQQQQAARLNAPQMGRPGGAPMQPPSYQGMAQQAAMRGDPRDAQFMQRGMPPQFGADPRMQQGYPQQNLQQMAQMMRMQGGQRPMPTNPMMGMRGGYDPRMGNPMGMRGGYADGGFVGDDGMYGYADGGIVSLYAAGGPIKWTPGGGADFGGYKGPATGGLPTITAPTAWTPPKVVAPVVAPVAATADQGLTGVGTGKLLGYNAQRPLYTPGAATPFGGLTPSHVLTPGKLRALASYEAKNGKIGDSAVYGTQASRDWLLEKGFDKPSYYDRTGGSGR